MGKNANVVTQAEDQRWEGQEHMEPLRVGIVGAGWMGHVHANAWSENAPRGEARRRLPDAPAQGRH